MSERFSPRHLPKPLYLAAAATAALLALTGGTLLSATAPANAVDGPQIADPGFENQSWENTQQNHSSFVQAGANGSGWAVQVGLGFEGDSNTLPGGNLPARNQDVSRGMVNKTVSGIEPNTKYSMSVAIKGNGIRWGIFDAENQPYYKGLAAGGPTADLYKGEHTADGGSAWETKSTTITTGPRTTELNAYCIMVENTGPGYCDDFAVTKVGPADSPQAAPATWGTPPATAGFPVTIPAIQQFAATTVKGAWAPANGVRQIVVDTAHRSELADEAHLIAANLKESGSGPEIRVGYGDGSDVTADSIFLTLGDVDLRGANDKAKKLSHEAYQLQVSTTGVRVTAGGEAGALYAGSTLVQALESAKSLPTGTVIDWTDQKFRGLQVDSGRRFYSIDWLKDQIKDLAYTKMNTLSLRIKDSQGMRIESSVLPKLVDNTPGEGHWSKAEIADLVKFAKKYHVTVIPEFDVPGHSNMDTLVYPEYMFEGYTDTKAGWDYSRPEVRQIIIDVLKETGETFDSPYVHVGGDEFFGQDHPDALAWIREATGDPAATSVDAYLELFNEIGAALKEDGRESMMWNDMINGKNKAITLNKDILVVYWAEIYGSLSADALIKQGYNVIGSSSDLYHDLWPAIDAAAKPNNTINQPLPQTQWATYLDPYVYSKGWGAPAAISAEAQAGSFGQLFPIWDDAHGWAPEPLVTQTLLPRLRVHAQSVWNSPEPVTSFAEFDPYLISLGHAPYFGGEQVFAVDEVQPEPSPTPSTPGQTVPPATSTPATSAASTPGATTPAAVKPATSAPVTPQPTADATLAITGTNTVVLWALGAGLLVLGGAATFMARRRRGHRS